MKRLIFPAVFILVVCATYAGCIYVEKMIIAEVTERLKAPAPVDTAINAQEAKVAEYLRSVGGLYPDLIAQVCMDTTMPEMCAAVAMVESTANPYTLPGDAGQSFGGWQQQDKHWKRFAGKVSTDPYVQAAQFDAVFSHMLKTRSLPGAVSAWNGGGDGYVSKVWKHYRGMETK